MDIQNPSAKEIKRILTTKSPYAYTQDEQIICLANSYLNPQVYQNKSLPLTLQSLAFHRNNPWTLQNSSITISLIEHEIKQLLESKSQQNSKNIFIIDCSAATNTKITELAQKFNIVRGYNFNLPKSIIPSFIQNNPNTILNYKQIQASTSREYISKQLQYQFNSATSVQQCGFIGPICIPNICQQLAIVVNTDSQKQKYGEIIQNVMFCYQEYSIGSDCPIFVDFMGGKENYGFFCYGGVQEGEMERDFEIFRKYIGFVMNVCFKRRDVDKNLVIINPKLILREKVKRSQSGQIIIQNQTINLAQIRKLYELGCNITFQLARYQNRKALIVIANLLAEYPKQTIISYGTKYKTDMKLYGGQGLQMKNSLKTISSICPDQTIINNAMNKNLMKLLAWNIKKQEIKIVKMWNCVLCNKQSPETFEAFRKFGKDFCSIKCLKSFKF